MGQIADVTVCIPTVPGRYIQLCRAVFSVQQQTYPKDKIKVESALDRYPRQGAWATRNRAAEAADTEWIAFLDDDDEFLPHHLTLLRTMAHFMEVDMVWGWFEVIGGTDPFPMHRGRQFDPLEPHIVPITYLIRRELFMDTQRFQPDTDATGSWEAQDMAVIIDAFHLSGGKLLAIPDITWRWHHHGWNTSGLPHRAASPC
jgi:hypothetical protein